jgi:hypothetical protein
MRLLEEIGAPERAAATVEATLAAGQRVMGFGHRVYRGPDPRALVLRDLVRELDAGRRWLALAEPVAATMARVRGLHPNVDFYSAGARHPDGGVPRGVRGEPLRRLGRARDGAARRQPADPALRRVRGAAGAAVRAARAAPSLGRSLADGVRRRSRRAPSVRSGSG